MAYYLHNCVFWGQLMHFLKEKLSIWGWDKKDYDFPIEIHGLLNYLLLLHSRIVRGQRKKTLHEDSFAFMLVLVIEMGYAGTSSMHPSHPCSLGYKWGDSALVSWGYRRLRPFYQYLGSGWSSAASTWREESHRTQWQPSGEKHRWKRLCVALLRNESSRWQGWC